MPFDAPLQSPSPEALEKIGDASGRRLFATAFQRAKASGAGELSAHARAWAALSGAGWADAGGVWKRRPGAPVALDRGARIAGLLARADAVLAKGYNPSQPRASDGKWTVSGWGGRAFASEQPHVVNGLVAPQLGGKPDTFMVKNPTDPTPVDGNDNPEDVAVYVNGFDPGDGLNGVPFAPWSDAPTTDAGWASVAGQADIGEPAFPVVEGKRPGSGVIIEEPDGRVWVVEPTNHFGGYEHTFPKGGLEDGMSAQANAIKETFEEAGLKVEITGYLGDYERTTSVARYYTARRVGGSPAAHAEESQSVKLVPKADLFTYADHKADTPIIADYLGVPLPVGKAAAAIARIEKGYNPNQPRDKYGKWSTGWGGGGAGAAMAEAGEKFTPLVLAGKNMNHSSIVSGNKMAAVMAEKANAGDIGWFKDMEASGKAPKPAVQTYAKKTYQNWVEAKAYAAGKASAPAKPATGGGSPVKASLGEPAVKLSSLEYDSPKPGGSAEGAIYKDASGQKWLVKAYPDAEQARQEVLASALYKSAGAGAPEMALIDTEGQWPGKGNVGVMSKWEDGVAKLVPAGAPAKAAQKDFAADAWLANWDAVGLNNDNIVLKDGKAIRIDPGGALEYRAMGDKKGAAWNDAASEWNSLRDPNVNPENAAVFGKMTDADLKASAAKVAAIDDATIKSVVAQHLPEGAAADAMAARLIARRDNIAKQAGLDVEHAKAPGKLHDAPKSEALPKGAMSASEYGTAQASMAFVAAKLEAGEIDEAKTMVAVEASYLGQTWNIGTAKEFQKHADAEIAKFEAYHAAKSPHGGVKAAAMADSPAGGKLPEAPEFGGSSAAFYQKKSADLQAAIKAGDMAEAAKIAAFEPKSASAKKSPNAVAFKAHAAEVMAASAAKADAVPAHMGPASKPASSPAKLPDIDDSILDGPKPTKSAGPPPTKGTVTSAANAGQQAKFDAIHEMGGKGDVDGIMAMQFGTNTYGKQQAKKANEWLVHHGYGPVAFAGMNGKNDPKAGLHSATGVIAGATPKPATSAAGKLKAAGGNPTPPPFKPENVSAAPDFNTMGSSGGPLSSVAVINEMNNEAVKLIEAKGKAGDLQALKAMTFPEVDKEKTQAQGSIVHTGKNLPMEQHPSSHVKAYFAEVTNEVDFQLNPPLVPTLGEIVPGDQFNGFKQMLPVPAGKSIAEVSKAQKAGAYVVLGKVASPNAVKEDNSVMASAQFTAKAKKQWESLTESQKQSSYSYVGAGSGWMNTMLQDGESSADLTKAVNNIKAASVDIPEGATFVRNMGEKGYNKKASPVVIKKLEQQLLSAEKGTVYQEPAFSSSSWTGTGAEVLANNNIQWRFTAGPGVKAAPLYASINAGEGETLFLPNQRYMIMGAKKKGKTVVVDAILLPTLE